MSTVVAGVDLGGTGSRFVLCRSATVLASSTVDTAAFTGLPSPSDRLDRFAAILRALLLPGETLAAVGIGASGPVDVAAGIIDNPDTLLAFSGFPLVQGLRDRLGLPIAIDNDAVTAAVAEHRLGAGIGARRLLMVTLGTGIGAALLIGGAPFRGVDGTHPEGGHIPIPGASGRCYCGAEHCWESAASRTALQRLLRPVMPREIPDQDLIGAAKARAADTTVQAVFQRYGHLVGQGLGVLHTLYQPDVTVLSGSAAAVFPLFEPGLRDALSRAPGFSVSTEVRPPRLGDLAGALGAAQLAIDLLPP